MTSSPALLGSLQITFLLLGTYIAWLALGSLRWDKFVTRPESAPARLLRLILAILIAAGIVGFITSYGNAIALLRQS